jgi:hypothetical protein
MVTQNQDFSTRLAAWFVSGDTGISSKCIAAVMAGVPGDDIPDQYTPSDPADLGRCLRLLELFPEWNERMPEMAKLNEDWANILPHWNDAAKMMAQEVGIDWSKGRSAPKTYNFMKSKGF